MASTLKPKRRNSEKRKEKSRNAARCRRSQETEIFNELAHELPFPYAILSQLDKASIIRVTIAHLKLRRLLAIDTQDKLIPTSSQREQFLDQMYCKSLDGFILMLTKLGDVVYVSKTVDAHIGLAQVDLLGSNILDFVHPCDHDDFVELLNKSSPSTDDVFVLVRMKCSISNKGRNANVKTSTYKMVEFTGSLSSRQLALAGGELEDNCVLVVGRPLPCPASGDLALDNWSFVSRHSLDLTFIYCDPEVENLLGYLSAELVDQSLLSYHHACDSDAIDRAYKTLFTKGQVKTSLYRFLAKCGGYAWVETTAMLTDESSTNHKLRCVVCIHRIVSEVENSDVQLASIQLPQWHITPPDSVPEAVIIEEEVTDGDDSYTVIIYDDDYDDDDDDDDDDNFNGMQFMTEQLIRKVVSVKGPESNDVDVVSSSDDYTAKSVAHPLPDRSPMLSAGCSDVMLKSEKPDDIGLFPTIIDSSLEYILDNLETSIEFRAPYIPLDDTIFTTASTSLLPDESLANASVADVDANSIVNTLDIDTVNMLLENMDTTICSSPDSAVVDSSSDIATLTNEITAIVDHPRTLANHSTAKRPPGPDTTYSVMTRPANKVQRVANVDFLAHATKHQKHRAVEQAPSSSSVLLNLLTAGIDNNWGYKLKNAGLPTVKGRDRTGGSEFPSLLQKLLCGPPNLYVAANRPKRPATYRECPG